MNEHTAVKNHLHAQQVFLFLFTRYTAELRGLELRMNLFADERDGGVCTFGRCYTFKIKLERVRDGGGFALAGLKHGFVEKFRRAFVLYADLFHLGSLEQILEKDRFSTEPGRSPEQ